MQENREAPSGEVEASCPDILERLREELERALTSPPPKALKAVGEKRLVRLTSAPLEAWVVFGEHGDYVVIPGLYCSCPHFTIKVLQECEVKPCYHLVAVELARHTGRFLELPTSDPAEVTAYIVEVLTYGRATSLRAAVLKS